jgi:hypothetical protein
MLNFFNLTDGYAFTKDMVSRLDFFHPSLRGQATLAALTWEASWWGSCPSLVATINEWAAGISDTLPLGLFDEPLPTLFDELIEATSSRSEERRSPL